MRRPFIAAGPGLLAPSLLLLGACGTTYTPRHTGAIGLTGDSYFKDGQRHARDVWVRNLGGLVQGCEPAEAAARSARRNQLAALGFDTASAITGIAAFVIALSDRQHNNDVGAQILFNTSLVTAILGPIFHIRAHDRELDAVNAYNDAAIERAIERRRTPEAALPQSTTTPRLEALSGDVARAPRALGLSPRQLLELARARPVKRPLAAPASN